MGRIFVFDVRININTLISILYYSLFNFRKIEYGGVFDDKIKIL